MSFADRILKNLFASINNKPVQIDSGKLMRTPTESSSYELWKLNHSLECLAELSRNLNLGRLDLRDDLKTKWFESNTANGFYVNLKIFESDNFESWFLIDLLAERTKFLGYRLYTKDYEIKKIGAEIRKTERIYLKPEYDLIEEESVQKVKQRYGNILLELIIDNETHLKLLSTIYFDRNYTQAKPFKEYLEEILRGS